MLSIDPILSTAMLYGSGEPVIQAVVNGVTYDVRRYRWDNLALDIEIQGVVAAVNQDTLLLKRGMQVAGVDYLVNVGTFFIESFMITPAQTSRIKAHAFPSVALQDLGAGSATYKDIMNTVGTAIGVTFDALTGNWWDGWDALETGRTLSMISSRLLQGVLMSHRRAHMFQRQTKILVSNPAWEAGTIASSAYAFPEQYSVFVRALRHLIIYTYDENNFQSSAYYSPPAPATAPSINIGYLHSGVGDPSLLGKDGGGEFSFVQMPDLALEQGEAVTMAGFAGVRRLSFIEYFNWGGAPAWRQVVSDLTWQSNTGSGYGQVPIQAVDVTIINNIENIVNNIVNNTINNIIQQFFEEYTINNIGNTADKVNVNTASFGMLFNSSHALVQACLDVLDDHQHGPMTWYLYDNFQ
jgi:hypothetical protein